jgi:uncharacterized protein (DUF697 family)
MNKKRRPKAVDRTADDMLAAAGVSDWPESTQWPINESRNISPKSPASRLPPGENVIAMASKSASQSGSPAPLSPATIGIDVERRQSLAHAIVERHANYSAIGGVIPLPLVNVASVTAIIVRMVKRLTELYGIPYRRDRARAIVIGLVGGAMPTGLSTVTASALFYVVPGSHLVGMAVSSVTASACTRRLGRIFIEHFESGATLAEFPTHKTR